MNPVSEMNPWQDLEESVEGRVNCKCQGPQAGTSSACWRRKPVRGSRGSWFRDRKRKKASQRLGKGIDQGKEAALPGSTGSPCESVSIKLRPISSSHFLRLGAWGQV